MNWIVQVPARLCLYLPVFHNGLASEKRDNKWN
jgi:hypothetical protein